LCRLDKIQTFFGPGIVAKLKETEQASVEHFAACHLLLAALLIAACCVLLAALDSRPG